MPERDPVYRRIQKELQKQIMSGKLPEGSRLPTEKVLADEFGVSVLTLRQAQKGLIELGLISKQQGRGTFVTKQKGGLRVLIVCGLAHGDVAEPVNPSPYFQNSIQFCIKALRAQGITPSTAWISNHSDGDSFHNGVELIEYNGFIFVGCTDEHLLLRHVREQDLNYVNLGKTTAGSKAVWFDIEEAGRMAAELSPKEGPVFVVPSPGGDAGCAAFGETGRSAIPLQTPWTGNDTALAIERRGYELIKQVHQGVPDASYVFLDDVMARGGTRALLEAKVAPEFVAVVCGEQEVFPYGLDVTFITHDTNQEATWAVEMLTAQMSGQGSSSECRQSHYDVLTGESAEFVHASLSV